MVKRLSEHRVVKPQREKLHCKLIPEPVCGLSCAKASLLHANLSDFTQLQLACSARCIQQTNLKHIDTHRVLSAELKITPEEEIISLNMFYFGRDALEDQ